MRLLIVSATLFEIEPLINQFSNNIIKHNTRFYSFHPKKTHQVDFLLTGPGILHTAFHLSRILLTYKYDMAINAGICGSFKKQYTLGDVIEIRKETMADFGAETQTGFIPASKMGLYTQPENFITHDTIINNCPPQEFLGNLPKVNGITVNTVHGQQSSIRKIKQRLKSDVESMEGFAFFYACSYQNVSFYAVRAVSNYIEPRNKNNWQIPLAIKNLNSQLINMLDKLLASWK